MCMLAFLYLSESNYWKLADGSKQDETPSFERI